MDGLKGYENSCLDAVHGVKWVWYYVLSRLKEKKIVRSENVWINDLFGLETECLKIWDNLKWFKKKVWRNLSCLN